ncbi:MAG: MAE_28990/MAE_18760 family HEPN-like nuclease [Cyanobacteria bacterium P01_A01_bin.83]
MESSLFEDFEERAKEVSKYFFLLKNLEQGSIKLTMGNSNYQKLRTIDVELEKTLKATGFLLLYNLIESTIRNAIEFIYDDIVSKEVSFDDLRTEIKKIVIQNFKKNKKSDTLLAEINRITIDIVSASFDKEKLFSGNIDARKIKDAAKNYGFSYQTNERKTQNGIDLLTIKTNRNDLAHGFKSFNEVGKDATSEELLKVQKRVICYLSEILQNIEEYVLNQEYLKQ